MGAKVDYERKVVVPNAKNGDGIRQLDTLYFTGAGYVDYPIKGISRDSALGWEEPVWGGDLTRSANFVLTNVLEVDYGLVARLEVSYKYLNVSDYIALCKIAKERVCNVTYFNYEKAEWVINQEFAFTKQEKSKLYAFGTDYLGLQDVSIKLVATNRDMENLINTEYTITYYLNGGSGTAPATQSAVWGDNLTIATDDGLSREGYTFKGWVRPTRRRGSHGWITVTEWSQGQIYMPNENKTMWENIALYAYWEAIE